MHRRRCCDNSDNLRELARIADLPIVLVCVECGAVLAHADEQGELFADY